MDIMERIKTAERLERTGKLKIGEDVCILKGGLIYIDSKTPPLHPLYDTPLDNPMTWDSFIHLYLLNK